MDEKVFLSLVCQTASMALRSDAVASNLESSVNVTALWQEASKRLKALQDAEQPAGDQ